MHPILPYGTLGDFLEALPAGPTVRALKRTASWMRRARQSDQVTWVGLDVAALLAEERIILLDLMERGWISSLSLTAQVAWTDFHVCLCGEAVSQEDHAFWSGNWGLAEESGLLWSVALREADSKSCGLGEALGEYLADSGMPGAARSLLAGAYRLNIPLTVHGGDMLPDWIHHPRFEPEAAYRVLGRDSHLLSTVWSRVVRGGVPLVLGQAGVLLQAVACAQAHVSALGISSSFPGLALGAGADERVWRQAMHLHAPEPVLEVLGRDRDTLLPLMAALLLVPTAHD